MGVFLASVLPIAITFAPQVPPQFSMDIVEPARAADARVVLTTGKPVYFLGENVIVRFCVENLATSPFSISVGGDYRGGARANRFKLTVIDANGTQMPDPWPGGFNLGGLGSRPEVKTGSPWCGPIPLMRYARIDAPGRYTIRATHDLGWKVIPAPAGEMSLDLRMPAPDEARAIVARTAKLPRPVDAADQFAQTQDYSVLRYPVYLDALRDEARNGNTAALQAIGSIPSVDATRALISFMRTEQDAALALQSSRQLAMRLPDPALDGTLPRRGMFMDEQEDPRRYLRDAGWRSEFASEVEDIAVRWLSTSSDPALVIQGAFMIQAVGTPRAVPSLTHALNRALDRTLTLPFEKGVYPRPRGAMQELLRAVNVLLARGHTPAAFDQAEGRRPTGFASAGEAVFWMGALERGVVPPNHIEGLRALLTHPIPYIRELALKRVPDEGPADLFDAIGPALASSDMDLQIAALDVIGRAKLVRFRPEVASLVATASDTMFLSFATNAMWRIGAWMEVLDIMAERLATATPEIFHSVLSPLIGVFADTRGSGGSLAVTEAEQQAMSARWKQFLKLHRADLEAGRKISLDDPSVTADLVPKGFSISRVGKPDWPIRR